MKNVWSVWSKRPDHRQRTCSGLLSSTEQLQPQARTQKEAWTRWMGGRVRGSRCRLGVGAGDWADRGSKWYWWRGRQGGYCYGTRTPIPAPGALATLKGVTRRSSQAALHPRGGWWRGQSNSGAWTKAAAVELWAGTQDAAREIYNQLLQKYPLTECGSPGPGRWMVSGGGPRCPGHCWAVSFISCTSFCSSQLWHLSKMKIV